ncbi:hypothetical protein I317_06849 [Kwoniella heveanensis CBS 569]|nr:hypothetical protein I317_06849 [Kwoniella heveanensis CBS 569]
MAEVETLPVLSPLDAQPALPPAAPSPQPLTPRHPFRCSVCLKRFTRHENLKRHSHRHRSENEGKIYSCEHCSKTFARSDLRRRHIRKQHPEVTPNTARTPSIDGSIVLGASSTVSGGGGSTQGDAVIDASRLPFSFDLSGWDSCILSNHYHPGDANLDHTSCSTQSKPNETSTHHPSFSIESLLASPIEGDDLVYTRYLTVSANRNAEDLSPGANRVCRPSTLGPRTSPQASSSTSDVVISQSIIQSGISLFFTNISAFFPFIHQPTFDLSTVPEYLVMAMLSVSIQFAEAEEHEGSKLAAYCFHRSCKLIDEAEQKDDDDGKGGLKLHMIQAYLLLEVHALCFARGPESCWGLRFHHRLTELARIGGLGDPYPPQPVDKGDLNALWRQFVRAETHKRTLYAAYHLDTLWYHTLSVPRGISHLEIKVDLPCPEAAWTIPTAAEWAFHGLVTETSHSPTRYLGAIRMCLSADATEKGVSFDTYGCLAMILYALSGVREMSGWSTVTGQVPIERFDTLYAALAAVEPIVSKQEDTSPLFILTQATWHMAMIDLLLWSPSHTNGVVELNVEAAMAAIARLSNSGISFSSPSVAQTVDRHIRWFLTYLDKTHEVSREAPWMAIYAFKAVLVAYQQVLSGNHKPLDALGLPDSAALLEWIKEVFARRRGWSVGKIALDSLEELDHRQ